MSVKLKGIDVSGWQGDINFKKVAADGVKFVIVKAGYSNAVTDTWEKNYTNAKNNGLKVGAYWYSYATTIDGAKTEAQAFIKALKGKQLDFPVYLDIEEKRQFDLGKDFCTKFVDTFCTELENAGYYAGVYCSTYWFTNFVDEKIREKRPAWIADYRGECYYKGSYGIWQYGVGRVDGIAGDVDMNWGYTDYSSYIKEKGLNGYSNATVKPSEPAAKKTVQQLAQEVLNGLWGNGDDRKRRLTEAGYNYSDVQAEVNNILYKPKKTNAELAQEVLNGKWGNGDERYRRLTEAGYSYDDVQAEVNKMLKSKPKKSVDEIAEEVWAGKWGNGDDRYRRLTTAGYDYDAVQKAINHKYYNIG